ncbi:MAG TPA: hypothetical protein VNZ58_11545 [Thermomicrobiales bacterium]|nr:hypothetical protein [Thermomicrobiales bacterium]
MPLERIEPRNRAQRTNPPLTRRLALGVSAVLLATALTACSGGNVKEAEHGREQDASRDSVVKGMQATETWLLVNATPTPEPSTPDE